MQKPVSLKTVNFKIINTGKIRQRQFALIIYVIMKSILIMIMMFQNQILILRYMNAAIQIALLSVISTEAV